MIPMDTPPPESDPVAQMRAVRAADVARRRRRRIAERAAAGRDSGAGPGDGAPAGSTAAGTGERGPAGASAAGDGSTRTSMNRALAGLVETMAAHEREGRELVADDLELPQLRTSFEGRQALVVVRGHHYKEDLAMLRSYIREYKPVLVGVDGGGDALLEAGYTPDLIVGNLDAVSDAALNTKAELVVHPRGGGGDAGAARLEHANLDFERVEAPGTNEDLALLMADTLGAQMIVAVGTNDTFVEFADGGRSDMATTFLTRLRVGSRLIDAKGVSLLYRRSVGSWQLIILAIAGLLAVAAALFATAAGQTLIGLIGAQLDGFFGWIHSLFASAPASE